LLPAVFTIMLPSFASKLLGLPGSTPKAEATNKPITAAAATAVVAKTRRRRPAGCAASHRVNRI
jgi:hypothetical protein